ncbi:LamG domain-containing protein [Micromonospora echinofusca]|uniref:LamG-like jellyroll fold domain-containing protein n=1 Tax=Micromonospora echinofusca TaxID=47858 RepID=A0ABS3VRU5_MICEH|nr:LamG domain-containing protein [Micromonospora echinofusca]MBO4207191.1 hypothetical protein [Micromonospora echinofusca]
MRHLAGAPAAAAPVDDSGGASPEERALVAAREAGFRVEVEGSKSELSRTLATPEGSLVLESYATPHWTRDGGSGWRQIDTQLRSGANGVVAPVATLADVEFSPGGTGPAVKVLFSGGELALSWPGGLPPVRIVGDTAVYESVFPQVDLHLRALTDGFTWVLVVHTPEAATNPALQQIRFAVSVTGGSILSRAGGGFEVVDTSGAQVLSAGSGLMWDSTGLQSPTQAGLRTQSADADSDATRVVPDLALKEELPVALVGSDLVVEPSSAMLQGVNTAFPVMIDPSTTINKIRWGYANQTDATRNDGIVRVGKNPDGSGNYRSFFSFGLTGLVGKTITGAKFITEMTHSYSCTSTEVSLWRSADLTTTGKQTWDGPNLQLWLEKRSGHAHKPSEDSNTCSGDPQPDLHMEFASAALKQDIIDNGVGQAVYTLALSTRRSDGTAESTTEWWKKFDPALTKLTVDYNSTPNTPTAAQLSTHADYTSPALGCVTGTGRPIVRSARPWMKATLTDPDGSGGGVLSGVFAVQKWDGTAWAVLAGWPKTDTGVAPGAKAEAQITGLVGGDLIRWQVKTTDLQGAASGFSPWCEFTIDSDPPAATPTVTSADGVYLESPPNDVRRGGVGVSGRFTFGANLVPDVYDYVYQLDGGPQMVAQPAALGGSVTVWITPMHPGDNVLTVRSRDAAQNASGEYSYVFLVADATAPTATWSMNEGSGTTVAAVGTGGSTASLVNSPSWVDSRVIGTHRTSGKNWSVKFDGVDDHASTGAAVVDTSKSFTVSAWVRADAITGSHVIVSQPGVNKSPFELQYHPSSQKWCFVTYTSDTQNAPATASPACATAAVQVGVWTHLTGVYDAGSATQLSLFVNGVQVGSGSTAPVWNSTGSLNVGRGRNGAPTGYFNGAIDDVRVWDRVVVPDLDLKPLVEPTLAGQWEMEDYDEDAPRQEGDGSGYQRPATFTGSPSAWWAEGYNFSGGLGLDGTAGSADTAAPVVRTDQSFTVAAWVKLTSPNHQAILAQDGSVWSAFYLMHNAPTGQWVVTMPTADGTTSWQANYSTSLAQLDTWTHLAAVYDAHTRQLKLYVNGQLEATRANVTGWHGNGTFHIGRAIAGNFAAGTIDRVRAWQGALTDADIQYLTIES